MYCNEDNLKKTKNDHRLFLIQQVKAKHFLKINDQKGFNENFL